MYLPDAYSQSEFELNNLFAVILLLLFTRLCRFFVLCQFISVAQRRRVVVILVFRSDHGWQNRKEWEKKGTSLTRSGFKRKCRIMDLHAIMAEFHQEKRKRRREREKKIAQNQPKKLCPVSHELKSYRNFLPQIFHYVPLSFARSHTHAYLNNDEKFHAFDRLSTFVTWNLCVCACMFVQLFTLRW